MTEFSANLGFLWTEQSLPDAIRAAKTAGFNAVECHQPYDTPVTEVTTALAETGLPMLAINTRKGNAAAGDFGLSAIPGREEEAKETIDEALSYAAAIDAKHVHVTAGITRAEEARATFVSNLQYACTHAAGHNIAILIEPLNTFDVPGYFLNTTDQAIAIINDVAMENLKLMFDCYHVHLMEGNITQRLEILMPHIGHIQFASTPGRKRPDIGEINYRQIFETIAGLGFDAPLGAEYYPHGPTEQTLDWMQTLR